MSYLTSSNFLSSRIDLIRFASIVIMLGTTGIVANKLYKLCNIKYVLPIYLILNVKRPITKSEGFIEIIVKICPDIELEKIIIKSNHVLLFDFDTIVSNIKKNQGFSNDKCVLYETKYIKYYQNVWKKVQSIYSETNENFEILLKDSNSFYDKLINLDINLLKKN